MSDRVQLPLPIPLYQDGHSWIRRRPGRSGLEIPSSVTDHLSPRPWSSNGDIVLRSSIISVVDDLKTVFLAIDLRETR